jgi:hypothetical protein
MSERAKHIAASVDADLSDSDLRYFPANPHTTDPFDWAHAFILSEDKSDQAVFTWFEHAMLTARHGFYHPDAPMDGD